MEAPIYVQVIKHSDKGYEVEVGADGITVYYKDGKWHRENGPAFDVPNGGLKGWYQHGLPHRVDGPAVISPQGFKQWWINGKVHREDGPAIEYDWGLKEWYLNGTKVSEEEFNAQMGIVKVSAKQIRKARARTWLKYTVRKCRA